MVRLPIGKGLFVLIDSEDAELVAGNWHPVPIRRKCAPGFYAIATKKVGERFRTIYMHRLIMGAKPGECVDHIDKDGLNNQKSNLRLCTHSQNNANSTQRIGRSGLRGVYWKAGAWRARIQIAGSMKYLGEFPDAESAARARDAVAVAAYGDFATLNFPEAA